MLPGAPVADVNVKASSSLFVPPLRPGPDSTPVVPLFDSVMVSVSVAPAFRSPIVTPVNGLTAASTVVGVACVPAIVGGPTGPPPTDPPTLTCATAVSHQALRPLGIVTPVLVTYSLDIQKPFGLLGSATALE